MQRQPRNSRARFVEDCYVVTASSPRLCEALGIPTTATVSKRFTFRPWLKCPLCGRRSFKLYCPLGSSTFACRSCHHLRYLTSQKHPTRVDQPVELTDHLLVTIENQNHR
jgi:hypothetical protein